MIDALTAETNLSVQNNLKTLQWFLCFQKITVLRVYLTTAADEWDCVVAEERLHILHYRVNFIFVTFGILLNH